MELSQYLSRECLLILNGKTKGAVLEELARALADSTGIEFEKLNLAIGKREELMSTGIGHGLGIPHVRMAEVSRPTMAVGVSPRGIGDYKSLDNKPVHIIVLIAVPEGQHEMYIHLLAQATEVLRHEDLRRRILQAKSVEELYELLVEGKS